MRLIQKKNCKKTGSTLSHKKPFQIVHFIVWLLVSRERLSATIQHETTSMAGEAVFAESATSVSLQSASTTNVGEMGALRIRDTGSSTLLGQGGHELNIV